jgi:hypothetical protein
MPDYAPADYRDRVWHIETDKDGVEWLHYNGTVTPSNFMSLAGTAGFPDEKVEQVRNGEIRYSEVRPAAFTAKARLQDMDTDGIDSGALPDLDAGLQSVPDEEFACAGGITTGRRTMRRRVKVALRGRRRPPMNDEDGVRRSPTIRRVAEEAACVGVPASIRRSLGRSTTRSTTRCGRPRPPPVCAGAHPFLMPDLPGAPGLKQGGRSQRELCAVAGGALKAGS